MSGHSKWATTKRKKNVIDKKRALQFAKISKIIMIAAKEGADPDMNPSLRVAIEKAKGLNMPKDKIEYALKKGSGTLEGVILEEIIYEGFDPHSVAIIIQTVTDNRNRTVSELKHLFSKNGGNLGGSNSVMWMFDQKGAIHIDTSELNISEHLELELIEQGADDILHTDEEMIVYTQLDALKPMREYIKLKELSILSAGPEFVAKEKISLSDQQKEDVMNFLEELEEQDDITHIFTNCDSLI